MMIPIRCFSCGALIADKYHKFLKLVSSGRSPSDALDELGVTRYCCRRMLLSHVEVIDLFLNLRRPPEK